MLSLALFVACSVAEGPSCVEPELHACSDIELARSCNNLFALDGLTVQFEGGAPTAYEVSLSLDGAVTTFRCADGTVSDAVGNTVWGCDDEGFRVSGFGDDVEVQVSTPEQSWTEQYTPCWAAAEPNGECCGWSFTTTVTLALG